MKEQTLESSILYDLNSGSATLPALANAVEFVSDAIQALSEMHKDLPAHYAETAQALLQHLSALTRHAAQDCEKELAAAYIELNKYKLKSCNQSCKDSQDDERIKYVSMTLRVTDKQIPADYPFRFGDMWRPIIAVKTGQLCNFEKQRYQLTANIQLANAGEYVLYDGDLNPLHTLASYMPKGLIPDQHRDVVHIELTKEGRIINWPAMPDVTAFFTTAKQ